MPLYRVSVWRDGELVAHPAVQADDPLHAFREGIRPYRALTRGHGLFHRVHYPELASGHYCFEQRDGSWQVIVSPTVPPAPRRGER